MSSSTQNPVGNVNPTPSTHSAVKGKGKMSSKDESDESAPSQTGHVQRGRNWNEKDSIFLLQAYVWREFVGYLSAVRKSMCFLGPFSCLLKKFPLS